MYVGFGPIITALTWYAVWASSEKFRMHVENMQFDTQTK